MVGILVFHLVITRGFVRIIDAEPILLRCEGSKLAWLRKITTFIVMCFN